jgi:hypothetical protein
MYKTSNKYLFYIAGGGRFGNQLLTMLHLMAYSIHNQEITIVNINFWYYLKLIKNKPLLMDYYLGKKPKGIYHFLLLNSLCINNIFTRKLFRYYSDFIRLILKGKKLEISASE